MEPNRTVAIFSPYKLHSFYTSLIQYPPPNYSFVDCTLSNERTFRTIIPVGLARESVRLANKFGLPIKLLSSLRTFSILLNEGDLLYAAGSISFSKRPFITDAEEAHSSWLGRAYDFRPLHSLIEKTLASTYCKKIICWNRATVNSICDTYNVNDFYNKIEVVSPAVPLAPEIRRESKTTHDLLFLGSLNIDTSDAFYYKGGHIVLQVFDQLRRNHDRVRLIIRSKIPQQLRVKLKNREDILLIEHPLSRIEFESLVWGSDILMLPSMPTPWTSFLDGMNHRLPVLTVDTHANSEIVESGKNGYVCKVPEELNCVRRTYFIPDRQTYQKINRIWREDMEDVVKEMASKADMLLDNENLRIQLGTKGRSEIETGGRYSISRRNLLLGHLLDEAVR